MDITSNDKYVTVSFSNGAALAEYIKLGEKPDSIDWSSNTIHYRKPIIRGAIAFMRDD